MYTESPLPPFEHVIHLGAGRCAELGDYLAAEPGSLLLVEADPRSAESLEQCIAGHENAHVMQAAVAAQTGQATFYRYNLPDANGLCRATRLHDLYPGLRLLEEAPIDTIGIAELLATMDLEPVQRNKLVIDVPGEEARLLEALADADLLHRFCQLGLLVGREPMYEGGSRAEELIAWLSERGYDLVDEDPGENPDRPRFTLRRNDMALEILALRQRVQQLVADRDTQAGTAGELAAEIQALRAELDEQRRGAEAARAELAEAAVRSDAQAEQIAEQAERAAALAQDRDQLAAARQNLQAQLDRMEGRAAELEKQLQITMVAQENGSKQLAELLASRDELQEAVDAAQYELQKRTQEWEQQAAIATERAQQIEVLTQAREQQARLASDRQQQLEQITQQCDTQKARIGELEKQIHLLTADREQKDKKAAELQRQRDELQEAFDAKQAELLQRTQQRDNQAKLASERALQIEALTRAQEEQVRVGNEREQQLDQLKQQRDAHAARAGELEKQAQALAADGDQKALGIAQLQEQLSQATAAKIAAEKLAAERLQQFEQAQEKAKKEEVENAEAVHRQQLVEEELVRAGAQIDLIKDLLLRDQTL